MKKHVTIVVSIFLAVSSFVAGTFLMIKSGNYFLNCYYSQKLTVAIKASDVSAVREIVQKRPECVNASPNLFPRWVDVVLDSPRETDPLINACLAGNLEIVKLLVQANANIDGNERFSPLGQTYLCKKENWYEIALYLIEHGASLNYVRNSSRQNVCVLEDILQKRNGSDLSGYVPENYNEVLASFCYALEHCDHSMVDWHSVLQAAVSNDRIEIVKLLLDERYCNVNQHPLGGMTALMFAARDSNAEMVSLLLEYGADASATDEDGKKAVDYANDSAIKDILESNQ